MPTRTVPSALPGPLVVGGVAAVVGHEHGRDPTGKAFVLSGSRRLTGSLHQLADADGVLLRPGARLGLTGGLGPDVGDRLFGVGHDQGPAVGLGELDAVDEDDVAVPGPAPRWCA